MKQNLLADFTRTKNQLAGALQDMWHECALILGEPSTFEGDRHHVGLRGKLRAYDALREKLDAWSIDSLPAFNNLFIAENPENMKDMQTSARLVFSSVKEVCADNNIDGWSGKIIEPS